MISICSFSSCEGVCSLCCCAGAADDAAGAALAFVAFAAGEWEAAVAALGVFAVGAAALLGPASVAGSFAAGLEGVGVGVGGEVGVRVILVDLGVCGGRPRVSFWVGVKKSARLCGDGWGGVGLGVSLETDP